MFSYKTRVRIDMELLNEVLDELEISYNEIGSRETHEGRSRFSQWNNMSKFHERLLTGEISSETVGSDRIIEVVGSAKGNSARVYFQPSVTSLAKPIRKCIKPISDENEFAFFDLRAAEFAMTAIFAQEVEAVNAYHRGEDIYMHYKNLFPEGTERKIVKKILIANMYGQTAYRVALDLGISEAQAQRLLDNVASQTSRMTMLKRRIYSFDRRNNGYFAPNGFNQNDLVKVADIDPKKGFNPNLAASVYTQSALGLFVQNATNVLLKKTTGTLLSVFDSMCVEINPKSRQRFVEYVNKLMSPLIPDDITFGKTFYEAAYKD